MLNIFNLLGRKTKDPEPTAPYGEFSPWPKTKHIDKCMTVMVTEKIDGTNACIVFEEDGTMFVQSRNRIITPSQDNAGFAKWAQQHRDELFHILGTGRHYGEWWGKGIGRKYDMQHNVFSLFNVNKFYKTEADGLDSMSTRAGETSIDEQISAVPKVYYGDYGSIEMVNAIENLRLGASLAAKEHGITYANPEGVCIYFREFDKVAKLVFAHPGKHKWEVN